MSTVTALKGTYPKNLPLTQVVCPRKGRAFPQKITEKTTANKKKKKKGEKKKEKGEQQGNNVATNNYGI